MKHLKPYGAGLLLAATLLVPGVMAADDDPPQVVILNGDEQVTITLVESEIEILREDDGATSVCVVDLAAVGDLAGEALVGIDEALAVLQDLQVGVHVGNDNNVQFSHDEETWEIDINEMMAQVGDVLRHGLAEMDTEDWTSVRERDRTTVELRAELRELKAEMRRLRRQLEAEQDSEF